MSTCSLFQEGDGRPSIWSIMQSDALVDEAGVDADADV